MDNCWMSCQVVADMKKVYNDLIIINLYTLAIFFNQQGPNINEKDDESIISNMFDD